MDWWRGGKLRVWGWGDGASHGVWNPDGSIACTLASMRSATGFCRSTLVGWRPCSLAGPAQF